MREVYNEIFGELKTWVKVCIFIGVPLCFVMAACSLKQMIAIGKPVAEERVEEAIKYETGLDIDLNGDGK